MLALLLVGSTAGQSFSHQAGPIDGATERWPRIQPRGCEQPFKFSILSANQVLEACEPGSQAPLGSPWLHIHDVASGSVSAIGAANNLGNPRGAAVFTLEESRVIGVVAHPHPWRSNQLTPAQRLHVFDLTGELLGRARFDFGEDIVVLSFNVNPYAQCAVVQHRSATQVSMPKRITVLDLRTALAGLRGDDWVLDLRGEGALTVEESEAWVPVGPGSSWHASQGYRCIRNSAGAAVAIGRARRVTGLGQSEPLASLSYIDTELDGSAVIRQIQLPEDVALSPRAMPNSAHQASFLYRRIGPGARIGKGTGVITFGVVGLLHLSPLDEPYEWRSFDPVSGIGVAEYFPVDPDDTRYRPRPVAGPVARFSCRPNCHLVQEGPNVLGPVNLASDGLNADLQVIQACEAQDRPSQPCERPLFLLLDTYSD